MGDLHVQIRLNGVVVDDHVFPVNSPIILGDFPGSQLVFPGASVRIQRMGSTLLVLGRQLAEGEQVTLTLPRISVQFGHTAKSLARRRAPETFDHRFLAIALVIVLVGSWIDAAAAWTHRLPSTELVPAELAKRQQRAGLTAPDRFGARGVPAATQGPSHRNDDALTGVGYSQWLRRGTPADERLLDAHLHLDVDADDIESRRVLAQAAYGHGAYEVAAWHYETILQAQPTDVHATIRLGWAWRRQGLHEKESALYARVLQSQPDHVLALSGLASAEIRMGQYRRAHETLDRLQIVAPRHPYTEVTAAFIEAEKGQDTMALGSLDRAVFQRNGLDRELRVELRRDIAVDPLFARLRSSTALRAMLRRHLGAAAPRSTR